ncbi:MAG TPA: cyclic nucleotide-binding domain-containing protein [Anaerolineales bacterium]|nr:cyclic nucleotide-binding domain-containing protein [Anaerolineales bacterium]
MNRVAIFNELDENQLSSLKPLFEPFHCRAGEVIFQQGEPAEFLYLVISGMVDMSFKPDDGSPITISHIGKGGLFGWSAVVGSDTYTSSAIGIEEVEAFRIHGDDLRKFCMEYPETGKYILERLADGVSSRWKDAHKQVKSILVQGMKK